METTIAQRLQSSMVKGKTRNRFLYNQLGHWAIAFEGKIYRWMDRLNSEYSGGYWTFFTLSNGGFFMAADSQEKQLIAVVDNGYENWLDSESAGIIVTLFTLCHMACSLYQKTNIFGEKYHLLLDFAKSHQHSHEILAAID